MVFAFAIALMTPAAAARATADETETVAIAYRVPEGCPSEAKFVSAVMARTHRARFVDHAPDARRFVVDIRRVGESYAGKLVVEEGSHRATREVTSVRCDEIIEAFVFFTAITLDPSASLVPQAPPAPSVRPPLPSPAPPPARRAPTPPPARRTPTPPAPSSSPSPAWHVTVGSGAFVATGLTDSAMFAAHPVVELASSRAGLSPAVSVGFAWANSRSQDSSPGRFTVGLRAFVLAGCGYHMRLGGDAAPSLRLCAQIEAGVIEVRPFAFVQPTSPARPWFAAGPLVRLDVPILPGRLAVRGDAALAFPTEREHVYAVTGPTVEVTRPVGLRFAVLVVLQAL